MSLTSQQAPAEQTGKLDRALVKTAATLMVGIFAVALDSTITNVALNTLAHDFDADLATIQWVTTAYMLAMAVSIPITGWAEHRLGGKTLWLASLITFAIGSIGSALSWNVGSLIVFRVVQGAAAGVAMALMMTIITRAAGGKNLGRIMALLGLPMLIIPLIGPVVGGAIITGVNWRWMFWINVPLCLAGIWLAGRFLDATPGRRGEPLDVVGLVTLACGSALVLYGFASAASKGTFTSTIVIVCLAAGIVLLAVSVVWALRASHPIVDLRLLRIPTFAAATVTVVLSGFMTNAGTLVLPLFFQQVLGSTALIAGVAVIPQALGSLATRTLAGKLTDRFGARWIVVIGTAIAALSTIPLAVADADTSWWVIGAALFLRGAGLSGVYLPAMSVAYLDVPKAQIPSSSIITRMLNNVGGTFGAALVAVTIQWVASAMGFSLVSSYHTAFWMVIAFTSLTLVSGFFLPRRGTGAAAAGA